MSFYIENFFFFFLLIFVARTKFKKKMCADLKPENENLKKNCLILIKTRYLRDKF